MSTVLERTILKPGDEVVVVRGRRRSGPTRSEPVVVQGYLSRWNTFHLVEDAREAALLGVPGRAYLEAVRPGAFCDAFSAHMRGDHRIQLLFGHGMDGREGAKPIGRLVHLEEDEIGPYFRAELLDAPYVRDLLPALRAKQFSASYRFSIASGTVCRNAKPSPTNVDGLPEVVIGEANVKEISAVTFPADPLASLEVVSPAAVAA